MSFPKLRSLYPNLLSSSSPYPLVRDLHRQFVRPSKYRHVLDNQFRVQVVSPELCDDTINLLSPSLEEYKNCDIVDFYPGAGLWSSKIHELVQPQNHILVEPNSKYLPFLKPLLDKPSSTYRYIPDNPSDWSTHERLVSEESLPRQAALPLGCGKVNKSLLILLNLTHFPHSAKVGRPSLDYLILSKMIPSILSQTLLNQHGSVRILAWVSEKHQRTLLPRRTPDRKTTTALAAENVAHITTVVSRDPYENSGVPHQQDLWSCRRALEASDRNGIIIPPHRRSSMYEEARRSLEDGQEVPVLGGPMFQSTNLWTSVWHDELFGMMKELGLDEEAQRKFLQEKRVETNSFKNMKNRARLLNLRKHWRSEQRSMTLIRSFIEREREVYRLEMSIKHGATDEERRTAEEQWRSLRKRQSQILARRTDLHSAVGAKLGGMRDTFWASIQEPPCLAWERRSHDPLVARVEEYWPQMPIALMDIQPKEISIDSSWSNFVEYRSHWHEVMRTLIAHPASPIREALRYLAVGSDVLIDRVPELTDPARGGRIDPEDVMVRTLPCETLNKLFLAFEDWPLKPDHVTMQINNAMHTSRRTDM